jgi:hypothetical protein
MACGRERAANDAQGGSHAWWCGVSTTTPAAPFFFLPQDAARVPVREPFLALLSERARDGVVKSARVPKHHRWFLVLGTLAQAAAQKPLLYSSDEAENRSLLRALKTRNTGRLADQPPTFFEKKSTTDFSTVFARQQRTGTPKS